jgi:hypothetical protein
MDLGLGILGAGSVEQEGRGEWRSGEWMGEKRCREGRRLEETLDPIYGIGGTSTVAAAAVMMSTLPLTALPSLSLSLTSAGPTTPH